MLDDTLMEEKSQTAFTTRIVSHPMYALTLVVVATGLAWSGALLVGFSTDDYIFIQHLAPIRSLADVFRPFVDFDPNPQYWRPLADASAALDFYLWGWSGQGFHLSNFLLHLLGTALVYPFSRRIFGLSVSASLVTALVFGLAASHESNVLWPAARADTLVTIFTILTILAHKRAFGGPKQLVWMLASAVSFWFALCSKENGVLLLPLLLAALEIPELLTRKTTWRASLLRMAPYILIGIAFYITRSHFATPMSNAEPIVSEGSSSIAAFLRNGIYSLAYTFVPLNLDAATATLKSLSGWLYVFAALAAVAATTLFLQFPRQRRLNYVLPLVFMLIAGVVTMQSFERWRLYMPSIGSYTLLVLLITDCWRRWEQPIVRGALFLTVALLTFFHIERAQTAQSNWKLAAEEVQRMKESLKSVLNAHPQRPISLNLISVPAKLGSASVMAVALPEFVRQCEAERLNGPGLRYGSADGAPINVERAIDVYALDLSEGFSGMSWRRDSTGATIIETPSDSHVLLEPALFKLHGVSRRDWKLTDGDTLNVWSNKVTILKADGSFARSVRVQPRSTGALQLLFDGKRFIVLE